MRRKFKRFVNKFLLSKGIYLSRTTDNKKLQDFFNSIKPINTNYDLIRIGGNSDGGYLIPNDIADITTCFSPGVSKISDFENELAQKGIKCFLADYSVEAPPIKHALFDFEKKYLGSKNDDVFMTLESWVKSKSPNESDLILQMDIEGSEFEVIIESSLELLNKFRILVIEFHKLDTLLLSNEGFRLIDLTFMKLLKNFEIVHIHPNNCSKPLKCDGFVIPPVMEFTFLRKDRISYKSKSSTFPHKLDRPNKPKNTDFPLPECWY
jgi:hypothetical protein